jgi:hypothetical protein
MKHESSDEGSKFITYDDNNLEHVIAGPDYGQVDSGSKETAWSELDSREYINFVLHIGNKILTHQNIFKKL